MGVSEGAYVRAVLAGDRDAFASLITPHLDLWLHIARSWVGNQADAEDVVQEALVQCYQHLGQFRGDAEFATWATRIVIRQCHRLTQRRQAEVGWDAVDELPVAGFEGLVTLRHAVRETLTPEEYGLFQQAVVEGRSWRDVGRMTGQSPGGLKTRWWRIKQRLQDALKEGLR